MGHIDGVREPTGCNKNMVQKHNLVSNHEETLEKTEASNRPVALKNWQDEERQAKAEEVFKMEGD